MHPLDSLSLPLSYQSLDRDEVSRSDPKLFDRFWDDDNTRIVAIHDGEVAVRANRLALFTSAEMATASTRVYLGKTTAARAGVPAGAPILAHDISDSAYRDTHDGEFNWVPIRAAILGVDTWDAGVLAEALAVLRWHREGVYCPRCGNPTIVASGGWMRSCFSCDNEIFPRTDPAIIVAVLDDADRLLLGSPTLRPNWWSLLAGFVEAGESLEAAVRREMLEESGLQVEVDQYLGSQPWPFPRSLMFGFTARVRGDQQLRPDGEEISQLRWISRAEFGSWSETTLLPQRPSIANAMISQWYGSPIESN